MKKKIKRRNFLLNTSMVLGSAGLGAVAAAFQQSQPRDPEPPFLGEEIFLWDDDSPNNGSHAHYRPKLRLYYPSLKRQFYEDYQFPVVLICPGGGYHVQAHHEGQPFAQLFAMHGIVGAVLTYRVYPDPYPGAYADATRAMRILRDRAADYQLDSERVGIMGFSAGGHLASTVATQPELYKEPEDDLADGISARPDRVILGYPVISFTESFKHSGSRNNLLGENPEAKWINYFSNEKKIRADSPPTFIFHSQDDKAVPVQNSLVFYQGLLEKQIPAEMHLYPTGAHGFSLSIHMEGTQKGWTDSCLSWMQHLK